MTKRILLIAAAGLFLATGCRQEEQFTITGTVTDAEKKTLYFEAVTLKGVQALDSTTLDKEGHFSFHGNRPENPEFFRLRIASQMIHLAVDSTETLHVSASLDSMATAYKVEGSENCELIRELSNKQMALQERILQTMQDKRLTVGEQGRIANEAVEAFKNDIKANYILRDPASSFAYFAFFQTLGGQLIFDPINNKDDIRYAGAIATSWQEKYPGTKRTENIYNIALRGRQNTRRQTASLFDRLDPSIVSTTGIIEIELPDAQGTPRRLSDTKGKVVLLDFTDFSLSDSKARTLELRELYNRFSPKGFEIYQVSLDNNEHYWKTMSEHLPWICVHEAEGGASDYVHLYQVYKIPAFFLIDKKGDLVARMEQIDDLEKTIAELCKE